MHESLPRPGSDANPAPRANVWEEHAGFLRRIATGLVADAASADDTLQDAWLAARKRTDAPPQRAWLAGVVRNVAARFRRSEARLKAREERAARSEALPSAAETVGRLEILQQVVDAVHALDEPYRTVLLLRFFDELAPSEIARRQGVPVETVRTQVRRGLARLRVRLTGEGGDERQWFAALLPYATLPPIAGAPAPATPATATGASSGTLLSELALMGTKTKLALALGALAVGSLVTWRALDRTSPARVANPVAAAPAAHPVVEEEARPAEPAKGTPVVPEERRALATNAAQAFTVTGQALIDGEPAGDLALVLRAWDDVSVDTIDTERVPDHEAELATDAEGGFAWSAPESATGTARIVLVQPAGPEADDLAIQWTPARAELEAGERAQPLVLKLFRLDGALIGTVRDTDGEPIAGARIWLHDDVVTSDEEGRYRYPLRSRGQVFVYAAADGFAQQRTLVDDVEPNTERTVDFALKPEFRVEGTVRDGLGQPIAEALVSSFYSHGNDVYTDTAGRFVLANLDPGRPQHMVHAKKEGWVLTQVTIPTEPDGVAELDFVLDRGVRVEGRVVDPDGQPVADASLYIGFSPHAFNRLDAVSAADGTFVFPSVQRGSEKLVVQRSGFGPFQDVLTLPVDADRLGPIDVVLRPGHFLGGVVVDEQDEPIEGVWVSVRYLGEHLDVRGETDAEGYFRIEDLPASDLTLSFYAPRQQRQRVTHTVESVDDDGLSITMPPAGGIAGRVVDGETGAPIPAFRIRFVDPALEPGEQRLYGYGASWSREGWLFENEEGRWDTESEGDLEAGGVIGIEAVAPGYARTVALHVPVTVDPDPDALVLRLFRGVPVSGTVVTPDGEPVEGALVKLYRAGESVTLDYSDDTHGRPLVETDRAGTFCFEDVAPGEHRVQVQSAGHPNRVDGPFEVLADRAVDRVIELARGATLTGTLRDASGAARASTTVELIPGGEDPGTRQRLTADSVVGRVRATTDASGRFRFEGLPEGEYRVGPRSGDEDTNVLEYSRPFTLTGSETRDLELGPPGTATLVGRLEFDGALPTLVPIFLVDRDAAPDAQGVRRTSFEGLARDGRFELTGLPAGTYGVRANWHDWSTSTMWSAAREEEVVLEEGRTSEVWLELVRAASR